uniref:Epiphycan n=1 Tax=Astyanax mexicanus TaxID=7994 RepID=A0A3B1IIY9_ASTMX
MRMMKMMGPCRLLVGLLVLNMVLASPRRYARQAEPDNYDVDVDLDNFDLDNDLDYYGIGEPQIEIGTLAPDEDHYSAPGASLEEEVEEEQQREKERHQNKKKIPTKPQLIPSGSGEPGVLMGPDTQGGMPTCLLCTCLGGSVYCDDVKLVHVPPLPKDTTHFYARYNKIAKINKSDFANMNKLKRIDLTSNAIAKIDDGAFFGLPALEELIIRENKVAQLPALPPTMTLVDASHNKLGSTAIQNEAFKDMPHLLYLYLTDNNIDYIPVPLPDSLRSLHLQNNNIQMIHEDTFCHVNDLNYIRYALEDVRLDGNPVNLSRSPQAYVCLPRIPVGALI